MSTAKLLKWGNSAGVRISAQDLKKIGAHVGEEFTLTVIAGGGFTLIPVKNIQEQWLKNFNKIADADNNNLLIDSSLENDFDKDEWTW